MAERIQFVQATEYDLVVIAAKMNLMLFAMSSGFLLLVTVVGMVFLLFTIVLFVSGNGFGFVLAVVTFGIFALVRYAAFPQVCWYLFGREEIRISDTDLLASKIIPRIQRCDRRFALTSISGFQVIPRLEYVPAPGREPFVPKTWVQLQTDRGEIGVGLDLGEADANRVAQFLSERLAKRLRHTD